VKIKRVSIFIIGAFALLSLGVFKFFKENKAGKDGLFLPISITQFSSGHIPCLDIEIESKKFAVELDLGYDGAVCIDGKLIQALSDKSFTSVRAVCGVRGNKHERNVYQIPKLHIGHLTFCPLFVEEENVLIKEESFLAKEEDYSSPVLGKLGWQIFKNCVLFLDLSRSKITICDTIETFKKQGDSLKSFTKVPLLRDRGVVECSALTPIGPLRCTLDTGFTFNAVHIDNLNEEPIEKIAFDEARFVTVSSLKIGEIDFGKTVFHPLPFNLPFPIEAVLGMDFFSQHRVLLDFKNHHIYFSTN
jgi:hypothetical protein